MPRCHQFLVPRMVGVVLRYRPWPLGRELRTPVVLRSARNARIGVYIEARDDLSSGLSGHGESHSTSAATSSPRSRSIRLTPGLIMSSSSPDVLNFRTRVHSLPQQWRNWLFYRCAMASRRLPNMFKLYSESITLDFGAYAWHQASPTYQAAQVLLLGM